MGYEFKLTPAFCLYNGAAVLEQNGASVKVLIDAYDGTTKFYITDTSDPIIMTYRNIYPNLFIEDVLPGDIQKHLVYPKFLYNVQADMINQYHDISEDTLYRADDIWQITPKASTTILIVFLR